MPGFISEWGLVFRPDSSPVTFASLGDKITNELRIAWSQEVQQSRKLSRTASTEHFPRGKGNGPISMGVYKDHASNAALQNWMLARRLAMQDLSGVRAPLRVTTRGGTAYLVANACIESWDIVTVEGGLFRTLETFTIQGGNWAAA